VIVTLATALKIRLAVSSQAKIQLARRSGGDGADLALVLPRVIEALREGRSPSVWSGLALDHAYGR
jgi:hypothetical protein